MGGWIDAIIQFVSDNRDLALWIALLFAAAETTALVSIVIPSTAILVGVGALVATGGVDFMPIWIGASIGAVIGSTFSWWLGRHYGEQMLRIWPLSKDPEMAEKGRNLFARHGGMALLIGHFFGPLRSVVFLIAGFSRMSLWRFMPWNVVGAIAWAFAVPKSGEIGGNVIGWIWNLISGG